MQQLNTEGYTMTPDNLIAGNAQNLRGRVVEVTVTAAQVKEIKRGQVIDVTSEGKYSLHAKGGTPSVIAAETVEVNPEATKVSIEVYDSGEFRELHLITSEALTAADKETLREKNIILK